MSVSPSNSWKNRDDEGEGERSHLDIVEVAVVGHAQLKLGKLEENLGSWVCRDDPCAVDWLPVLRRIRYMLLGYVRVSCNQLNVLMLFLQYLFCLRAATILCQDFL